MFLWDLAKGGMIDQGEAMKRVLTAMSIDDVEDLLPEASQQDQMLQQMQMMNASLDLRLKAADIDKKMAETIKAIAQAEGEEDGRQLNEYMNALEAMKKEVEIGQERFGNMAQRPGDGGAAGGNAGAGQPVGI